MQSEDWREKLSICGPLRWLAHLVSTVFQARYLILPHIFFHLLSQFATPGTNRLMVMLGEVVPLTTPLSCFFSL